VELLGEDFPGETGTGAAIVAAKVRTALNIRFKGQAPPRTLFVDRGRGFWAANTGVITPEFKEGLKQNRLKTFYGDNAKVQPGSLQEVLLHETAVAWIRRREGVTKGLAPWKETPEQFGERMRNICSYVNSNFDVDGLCRALPKRVQAVIDAKGDRINK